MDTPLLTIAEASEKTGRSPSTIRRLIRTIADTSNHEDRSGVEPTPKAVDAFKKKGENFTWKIREDVLTKHLPGARKEETKNASGSSELPSEIFEILRQELELKNHQIEKQWEVIHALNDRLREGNILMGSLQQKLSLPSPEITQASSTQSPLHEDSTEAIARASKKKVAEVKQKLAAKDSVKASKKGIFAWMFR